jgi:hypothetical protein
LSSKIDAPRLIDCRWVDGNDRMERRVDALNPVERFTGHLLGRRKGRSLRRRR